MTFKIGDVVRLTACSQPMTVERVAFDRVECAWFDSSDALQRCTLPASQLVLDQRSPEDRAASFMGMTIDELSVRATAGKRDLELADAELTRREMMKACAAATRLYSAIARKLEQGPVTNNVRFRAALHPESYYDTLLAQIEEG